MLCCNVKQDKHPPEHPHHSSGTAFVGKAPSWTGSSKKIGKLLTVSVGPA